jgi:hypothetical protein
MRFRFRKPASIVSPKLSPDPAAAAELARRLAGISFRPSYGFIVDEVKKAGPRFDAPAPVVEATPEQVLELVQAPAQDPTAQQIVSEAPVARTPSDTAAPAGIDWSKYDSPACKRRRVRPSRARPQLRLLNIPAFLRRQAD